MKADWPREGDCILCSGWRRISASIAGERCVVAIVMVDVRIIDLLSPLLPTGLPICDICFQASIKV